MLDPQPVEYTAPTSPLLETVHGAVAAGGIDAPVAAHYGQPHHEQRALAFDKAVVDLSHYGVVTVTGAERLSWLHVLVSQDLAHLAPGVSTETLFLDLRGRIDFAVKIVDDGETAWLITEPGINATLAGWLNQMKFAADVTIADVTDTTAILGSTQPLNEGEAAEAIHPRIVYTDPWPNVLDGGFAYPGGPMVDNHPGADYRWHLNINDRDALPALADGLPEPLRWAGVMASEALRIAAGRPRQLVDTDEKAIPHEFDWLRTAVHLNKGCYKGQETIARVHNLGHPPRRLALVMIDGSVHGLPDAGSQMILRPEDVADTEAMAKARSIGTLTSVADHYEMGAIGLALLRRNVDPDAELIIRETDPEGEAEPNFTAASQEVLVSPLAGNTVGRPQGLADLRRGR